MKRLISFSLCLLALVLPSIAQPAPAGGGSGPLTKEAPPVAGPVLSKFNLDFPGGTPGELVAAIQKAMGRTINVIIPDEHARTHLPALQMHNVTLPQLFRGLELASLAQKPYVSGAGQFSWHTAETAFRSENTAAGDDSVWYFFQNSVIESPRVCRFFPLEDYLASGLTVDDIITAVQSGWKMLGDSRDTALSFHKETKLLIAVGEMQKLETIDQVLKALESHKRKMPAPTPVGEEQKTKG